MTGGLSNRVLVSSHDNNEQTPTFFMIIVYINGEQRNISVDSSRVTCKYFSIMVIYRLKGSV
jgi:hypothetical protein